MRSSMPAAQPQNRGGHLVLLQRRDNGAVARHPLVHLVAVLPGNEAGVAAVAQVEGFRPVAARELQHIAEPVRGDQRGAGALALDEGVDDVRGAVLEDLRLVEADPGVSSPATTPATRFP